MLIFQLLPFSSSTTEKPYVELRALKQNIQPIFQTLPYIAESMVYGVLEGVVIAENDHGALFWTPKMGCAILPSTSLDTPMPSLGSVHVILVK